MNILKQAYKYEWHNLYLVLLPIATTGLLWEEISGLSLILKIQIIGIPPVTALIYLVLAVTESRLKKRLTPVQSLIRTFLLIVCCTVFGYQLFKATNKTIGKGSWIFLVIAACFLISAQLLRHAPYKCKFGIRLPWTLNKPKIWQKTHYFGSQIWTSGSLLIISLFVFSAQSTYILFSNFALAAMVQLPIGYAFLQHKKTIEK